MGKISPAPKSPVFKDDVKRALGDANLKVAIDRTTVTAEAKRTAALADYPQFAAARRRGTAIKEHVVANLGHYLEQFERNATASGAVVHWAADAEEACQDALLLVATRIHTFAGRAKFTTWLHAVASNSARSTYRSLKRRSAELPSENLPAKVDPRTTSVIAGSRLDLLDALEVLAATHPLLVEALVLRDIQELDYNEISLLMDLPLGTVKSRIHQARKTIQPLLIAQL